MIVEVNTSKQDMEDKTHENGRKLNISSLPNRVQMTANFQIYTSKLLSTLIFTILVPNPNFCMKFQILVGKHFSDTH